MPPGSPNDHSDTNAVLFGGESFALLPERAVYWERERALLVADVHLGKAQTFQRAGIPVPQAVHDADLDRLSHLLHRTGARRLIVLGDLFHSSTGFTEELLTRFRRWLDRHELPVTLVGGNHDVPLLPQLSQLPIEIVDDAFSLGNITFSHAGMGTGPRWSGHAHPVLMLRRGGESLRLPCFWFREEVAVLPAFGAFTGGKAIRPAKRDRVFVVADDRVLSWNFAPTSRANH
jgi:DNA ligase-associated metallophosphoesterase